MHRRSAERSFKRITPPIQCRPCDIYVFCYSILIARGYAKLYNKVLLYIDKVTTKTRKRLVSNVFSRLYYTELELMVAKAMTVVTEEHFSSGTAVSINHETIAEH